MLSATSSRLTGWLSLVILLVFTVGLISSLFLKERWLWEDEAISYVFLSDSSLAHVNRAVVGGLDANPPLFLDLYWLVGHGISLSPMFLRAVTISLFALTAALCYRYCVRLLGRPVATFFVLTLFVSFTYLNFTLSTQVRGYALLGLLHWLFFTNSHQLALNPAQRWRLAAQLLLGTALAFTHNFGLLYAAVMGAFFLGLAIWSGRRAYWPVLGVLAAVALIWLVVWFPNFQVQALAGKPHSWIVLPTLYSFFRTVGELLPTPSARLETRSIFQIMPVLRVVLFGALLIYLSWRRLRQGYAALLQDPAGLLLVQAGFVALGTTTLALVASFTVTSVFISRYLWPNHLLFAFVAVYAWHHFVPEGGVGNWLESATVRRWVLPAYAALLPLFVANQNRKSTLFSSGILTYLPALNSSYPLFFESADYFLPIWFQRLHPNAYFLLDWPAALRSPTLASTVDYHIVGSLREHYKVPQVVPLAEFSGARFPHFYVVDLSTHYQIEPFLASGRVRIVRIIPTTIPGHRILECEAVGAGPLAAPSDLAVWVKP